MNAPTIIRKASAAGVHLRLVGNTIKAKGNQAALDKLLPELRAHRPAVLAFLREQATPASADQMRLDPLTAQLLAAAMRVCDRHGDSDKARQEMRDDVINTPPDLRQDLQGHLDARPPSLP